MRGSTVSQIQIDEALIGDADLFRERFEVVDGFLVQADRDLLLQLGSVRVLSGGGEVIFFAHDGTFTSRTWFPWVLPCRQK